VTEPSTVTPAAVTTLPVAMQASPLRPGQLVVHRLFNRDRLSCIRTGVLVAHDEHGLRLWYSPGNPGLVEMTTDGRGLRDMPFDEWIRTPRELAPIRWTGPDMLMYVRPATAHSVWWFFRESGSGDFANRTGSDTAWRATNRVEFNNWYVNLEEPSVLWHDGPVVGIDTVDQDLDIVAHRDGTWSWKDEDEFTERLAYPAHYWVADERAVRDEGCRAVEAFTAGLFPFDGTWCDWRPDPAWERPAIVPETVRRPRVHYGQ
jgi:hypothetical protein